MMSLARLFRHKVFLILLLIAGIVVGMLIPEVANRISRNIYGVAPGVYLENRSVGRLLPAEVEQVIAEISQELAKEAKDAYYDQTQRKVVPESPGQRVIPDKTLQAVLDATPDAQVRAVLEPVFPAITHLYFQPVFRGDMGKKAMALMINVAWGNEYIPDMLRVLAEHKVKATFFFIGRWVDSFPTLFREIVAGGHEIANHGYTHGHPRQMSLDALKEMVVKGEEALINAGASPSSLFAPPGGEYDDRLLRVAAGQGLRTILWTIDTVDWKRPAPEVIVNRVVSKAQNGALVLMHPTQPTLAALPTIISTLQEKGYDLTTVSQILSVGD